jgi:hypothetical protein
VLLAVDHLPTVASALKAAKAAYHTVWTISQLISVLSQAVIAVQEWAQDTTCAIQDTAVAVLSVTCVTMVAVLVG